MTTEQQARHDQANRDTVTLLRAELGCEPCEVCDEALAPGTSCDDQRCVVHARLERTLEARQ